MTRRTVAAAHLIEAIRGDKIGCAVDGEDAPDAGPIVEKPHGGAGNEHAALHTNEDGGVGASELAGRNHFLHQGIYIGPIHGRTRAGDQRHGVEMPKLQVSAPSDVRGGQHNYTTDGIQQYAEDAAIEAVDEHAAHEGYK